MSDRNSNQDLNSTFDREMRSVDSSASECIPPPSSKTQDRSLKQEKADNTLSKLCICLFSTQSQFIRSVERLLTSNKNLSAPNSSGLLIKGHSYELNSFNQTEKLIKFVRRKKEQIDCLIFSNSDKSTYIINKLQELSILLPIVVVETEEYIKELAEIEKESARLWIDAAVECPIYHHAETHVYPTQLKEIDSYINLAINKFLALETKINNSSNKDCLNNELDSKPPVENSLAVKQRRLTNKIKERLGYSGIYSKRNIDNFYRNLSTEDKKKLNQKLTNSYRQILLNYFNNDTRINKLIDEFVDLAFFADVSTSQIIEIHMELIDNFAHQLKIEGRSDDILLDYRLPLIDVISHVCEMYRRSIPHNDVSLELLFRVQ